MKKALREIITSPFLSSLSLLLQRIIRRKTLLSLSLIMLISYNFFSFVLIEKLKREYKGILLAYIELIEKTISEKDKVEKRISFLKEIVNRCVNPIIITNELMEPIVWKNIYYRNKIFIKKEIKYESQLNVSEKK